MVSNAPFIGPTVPYDGERSAVVEFTQALYLTGEPVTVWATTVQIPWIEWERIVDDAGGGP